MEIAELAHLEWWDRCNWPGGLQIGERSAGEGRNEVWRVVEEPFVTSEDCGNADGMLTAMASLSGNGMPSEIIRHRRPAYRFAW